MFFTANNKSAQAILATGTNPEILFRDIDFRANDEYGFSVNNPKLKLLGLSAIGSRVKDYPGYNSDYDFFGIYTIHNTLAQELNFPTIGKNSKVLDLDAEFQINFDIGGSIHVSIRMLSLPMWVKMISQGQYDNCLAAHHPAIWRSEAMELMHATKTYADECIDLQRFYHIKHRFIKRCYENTREGKLVGEVDSPSRAFDYFHSLLLMGVIPLCADGFQGFSGLYKNPKTLINLINHHVYWKDKERKAFQDIFDCGQGHYTTYSMRNVQSPPFDHRKVFKDLSDRVEPLLKTFESYSFEKNDELLSNRRMQQVILFAAAVGMAKRPWKISEIF